MNVQRRITNDGSDAEYGMDELLWFDKQSALLRNRDAAALDWDNLAEEIQDMGNRLRHEVESRTITILLHMIKLRLCVLEASVAGWMETIVEQREQTNRAIEDAPSLARHLEARFDLLYQKAEKTALISLAAYEPVNQKRYLEAAKSLPALTLEQVLDDEFFPGPPQND